MAIDPEWTPASLTAFTDIVPGTPTAAQSVDFWNDEDGTAGADDIVNGLLRVVAKLTTGGADFQSSGLPVLDNRWVQMRITGGLGGLSVTPTGWVNVGADLPFDRLPATIASQQGFEADVRLDVPLGETQPDAVNLEFRLDADRAIPLATGTYEAGGQGILDGIGDDTRPASFFEDVTITATSPTPDDDVTISDARWRDNLGIPHVELTHVETISDVDGDTATITGTEGYKITVSYGQGSAVTLTKGSKADPGSTATAPAAPSGEKVWGEILVALTGGVVKIEAADITRDPNSYPETAAIVTTSGLDRTYSGRVALVGGRKPIDRQNTVITHANGVTESAWIKPDGTMAAAASSPEVGSLEVWQVTTAGSVITSEVDRRCYLDHLDTVIRLSSTSTILTVGVIELGVAAHPGNRPLYLRPLRGGIVAMLHEGDPSSLGYTSGSYVFGLEKLPAGGSWTTMFTSKASDDRQPSVAWNATDPVAVAVNGGGEPLAEVLVWNPGELLRATIDATGLGGSGAPAAGATVMLRFR